MKILRISDPVASTLRLVQPPFYALVDAFSPVHTRKQAQGMETFPLSCACFTNVTVWTGCLRLLYTCEPGFYGNNIYRFAQIHSRFFPLRFGSKTDAQNPSEKGRVPPSQWTTRCFAMPTSARWSTRSYSTKPHHRKYVRKRQRSQNQQVAELCPGPGQPARSSPARRLADGVISGNIKLGVEKITVLLTTTPRLFLTMCSCWSWI